MKYELPTKESILIYLKSIKSELEEEGISKLGLFGSYAKQSNKYYSDVDITIATNQKFLEKFDGFKGFNRLQELEERISQGLGYAKVDLFDLNSQSPYLESVKKETIYV